MDVDAHAHSLGEGLLSGGADGGGLNFVVNGSKQQLLKAGENARGGRTVINAMVKQKTHFQGAVVIERTVGEQRRNRRPWGE